MNQKGGKGKRFVPGVAKIDKAGGKSGEDVYKDEMGNLVPVASPDYFYNNSGTKV